MLVTIRDAYGKEQVVDLAAFKSLKHPSSLGDKKAGAWGILMYDDVDFSIFQRVAQQQQLYQLDKPVIVTSGLMKPFMEAAQELLRSDERVRDLRIIDAPNRHFGGNVCIAGLLTLDDVAIAVEEQNVDGNSYHISSSMLSRGGFDIAGRHTSELRARLRRPVLPLMSYTGSL
jgi:hypothetical protein